MLRDLSIFSCSVCPSSLKSYFIHSLELFARETWLQNRYLQLKNWFYLQCKSNFKKGNGKAWLIPKETLLPREIMVTGD